MDVLSTITINDVVYKVDNQTDYYFDGQVDCSYGFELGYKNRRGIEQYRWLNTLGRLGFGESFKHPLYRGVWYTESKIKQLSIPEFIARPFTLQWTLGETWYGLMFDSHEFVLQDNHGKLNLNQLL